MQIFNFRANGFNLGYFSGYDLDDAKKIFANSYSYKSWDEVTNNKDGNGIKNIEILDINGTWLE